ncbi:hypothetical protein VTI28DRAFT_305 [Corynascus sepedonium]
MHICPTLPWSVVTASSVRLHSRRRAALTGHGGADKLSQLVGNTVAFILRIDSSSNLAPSKHSQSNVILVGVRGKQAGPLRAAQTAPETRISRMRVPSLSGEGPWRPSEGPVTVGPADCGKLVSQTCRTVLNTACTRQSSDSWP